jgi:hypothetical protein
MMATPPLSWTVMKMVPRMMKSAARNTKPNFCKLTRFKRFTNAINNIPPVTLPMFKITSAWTDVFMNMVYTEAFGSSLVIQMGLGPLILSAPWPHIRARNWGLDRPMP